MVGSGVAGEARAEGRKIGMESDFRRDGKVGDIIWRDRHEGTSVDKSRTREEFPSDVSQEFGKERVARLYQGELEIFGACVAVNVVVYVAADVARGDLIGIVLEEELAANDEAAAAVVGNEAGRADGGRGRNLVLGAERENKAKNWDDSRTDSRAGDRKRRDDEGSAFRELILFLRLGVWLGSWG